MIKLVEMSYKDDEGKKMMLTPEVCYREMKRAEITTSKYTWAEIILDELAGSEAISGIEQVLRYGLEKYGKENSWKLIEDAQQRYFSAYMRHMKRYEEDPYSADEESGILHLNHARCNAMFLLWFEIKEN